MLHAGPVSVRAGSNTATVALQVVGGDEKGTQYLGANRSHKVTLTLKKKLKGLEAKTN
jgi:hypothetical protein